MMEESETLRHISVDDFSSGEVPSDAGGVLLDVGSHNTSARTTYELIQLLEENDVSPSTIRMVRVASTELGRQSTGSGDLYKKATDLQQKQAYGKKEIGKGLEPEYVLVAAPKQVIRGTEASIADTVEQIKAAQDTIRDVDAPIDFTGEIVLENRPDSILSSVEDVVDFRIESMKQGFSPLYAFDLTIENGGEMRTRAVAENVPVVRRSDGYRIVG